MVRDFTAIGVLSIAALVYGTFTQTQGARISGWTRTDTGEVLPGVSIALACPKAAPAKRTVSDESGLFRFDNLPPGDCHLWGSKPGYVDDDADGDPGMPGQYNLRIAEGSVRDGVELRLARGVTVRGSVSDPEGKPLKDVFVNIVRRVMVGGRERTPGVLRPVSAAGVFEANTLPPGEYFVAASPATKEADGGAGSGLAITFFPGTTNAEEAQTFVLKAGESKEISFRMSRTRAFAIRGTAYDASALPLPNADMYLIVDGRLALIRARPRTAADGTFVILGVQPGKYILGVRRDPDIGEIRVVVGDGDLDQQVLRLGSSR